MAGDWIKLTHVTPDKPEIDRIATTLGIDHDTVLGKLVRLWIWADQQTVDGDDLTASCALIDRVVYCPGFAEAVRKSGWLKGRSDALKIHNFARHCAKSAKERATNLVRKKEQRQRENGQCVTEMSRSKRDKSVTREEKRREDNINPPNPPRGEWAGILPKNCGRLAKLDQKTTKVLKNHPTLARLGKLFGRKETTLPTIAEALRLKSIDPPANEVEQIVDYYENSQSEILRKDLVTLLNNWSGELDRGAEYVKQKRPSKPAEQQSTEPQWPWKDYLRTEYNRTDIQSWEQLSPVMRNEIRQLASA